MRLDTSVVFTVNDGYLVSGFYLVFLANALNNSPGEYSRKKETQRWWRELTQTVEHVF